MRNKFLLFFLLVAAVITGFMVNSCKKDADYLPTLLTTGKWQLASVQVQHLVGDTLKTTDTLYTACSLDQFFTFNTDGSCTFANYSCNTQPVATGHWAFSTNKLSLISDMVCDSAGTSTKPFKVAQILNLGQYSLVLRTGNLESFYPPTRKRTLTRYGFVRVKTQ